MSDPAARKPAAVPAWTPAPPRWGWWDLAPIAAWLGALAAFFGDAVALRRALFYFDLTEINYPYRAFVADELRAGRFSRWLPGLYNGMPLFAESQAGYLHPLKLLYVLLPTWQALNLDTVGSIALTGLGMYGWMRGHLGRSGALAAAATFALSGFVWAHLIHTSMNNALVSVPLAFWGLEASCAGGRPRGVALGALALACQVFAGHLQDTILTTGALGVYTLYRAATARTWPERGAIFGFAGALVAVGVAVAAVQWVPSKNLLDRSPRVGGLTWEQITYGSWSPELLPTLVVREAYGTLARDTDWMDGYYPYHEMNVSMSLIALGLAVVGAGAWRDRWVGGWVVLLGVGGVLMLGRYTALFDYMNRVPVVGSSRIPVRYHLWVSLAVAVLAGVGVDRLARPGAVRLRGALGFAGVLVVAALAIAAAVYAPAWTDARRWNTPEHREHFAWLGRELAIGVGRTVVLAGLAWWAAARAARATRPGRRALYAAVLPVLIGADLLGSHWWDVPTVAPSYWTEPPESVARVRADPGAIRVFGVAERSAAEPGFASRPVDFFEGRDTLGWSLPPVWGLRSSAGHTPLYPRRVLTFQEHARPLNARYDAEGVTHLVTGRAIANFPGRVEVAGAAFVHHLATAQPRARLMGRPVYVGDEAEAAAALDRLGPEIRDRLIVEDPERRMPKDTTPEGTARIVVDLPERVEVEAELAGSSPAYLVLADTFDPGWSCTVDGEDRRICPAFAAFRAVGIAPGKHRLVFTYEPAGWRVGLAITSLGLILVVAGLAWPRPVAAPAPMPGPSPWPRWWPLAFAAGLALFIAASAVRFGPHGLAVQSRWDGAFHRFTWAADIDAIRPMSKSLGR